MSLLTHGRFDGGFGWNADPDDFIERSSTALADGGRVWLIDPARADGLEEAVQALGKVAGIVMTFGGHDRDLAWFSALYGVPVYAARRLGQVPLPAGTNVQYVERDIPDSPLQLLDASGKGLLSFWKETVVWWPERAVMVTGDCLGNAGTFVRPGERLAVHPVRRLSPPTNLAALRPQRLYCGHGFSLTDAVMPAIEHALATALKELPAAWLSSGLYTLRHFTGQRSSAGPSR